MRINLVERDKWSGAAEGIFRMFMFLTIGFLAALPRIFGENCGYPAVPAHAAVQFDQTKTVATFTCEPGYLLLGSASRVCRSNDTWSGIPGLCVVDVALGKPAKSTSQKGSAPPSAVVNASITGAVSQDACHSTEMEIASWWSITLLGSYVINSVKMTMGKSCCGGSSAFIEVRVGDDREISRNALCGRYDGIYEQGAVLNVRCYRPLRGLFLSIHQTSDTPKALSLCKVQAFSDQAVSTLQCPITVDESDITSVLTFSDQCYHFFNTKPDTWEIAKRYCTKRGGSLVWNSSPALQAFLSWAMAHRYHRFSMVNPSYWMGASRTSATNGEWTWVKENVTVDPGRSFWSSHNGSAGLDGGKSCAMFDANSGWLWRATECTQKLNWICEFAPLACGAPEVTARSVVRYTSTDVGSWAVYTCSGRLNLRGRASRLCQPDGKWSHEPPACVDDGCGPPPRPENGYVNFNSTFAGAVAQYECPDHLKVSGNTFSECTSDGSWSNKPTKCIAVDCGQPPNISHGSAVFHEISPGSVLKYKCTSGYKLVGKNHLVCDDSGSWQGEFPFCEDRFLENFPSAPWAAPRSVINKKALPQARASEEEEPEEPELLRPIKRTKKPTTRAGSAFEIDINNSATKMNTAVNVTQSIILHTRQTNVIPQTELTASIVIGRENSDPDKSPEKSSGASLDVATEGYDYSEEANLTTTETNSAEASTDFSGDEQSFSSESVMSNLSESQEALLDKPIIFTLPTEPSFSRSPLDKGLPYSAEKAMMRNDDTGNYWEMSSAESVNADLPTTQTDILPEISADEVTIANDSELYDFFNKGNDLAARDNGTIDGVPMESGFPGLLGKRNIGVWIALGVFLPVVLLFLLTISILCILKRKRRNEECPSVRVSSNPIYSVIQERNGRKLGGDFHASRYSKPWDTLQFQVEKATTPRSDATDCGGLRSRTNRELNPVTATSELTVSPSRPGTIKSESSDGASEALNESDEIMIDQSVALMLRRISLQDARESINSVPDSVN